MQAKQLWKVPGYVVLAGALSIGTAIAAPTADEPIRLAAVFAPALEGVREAKAFPAHEAGVRAAAASGPEALRRYVHRTRMIHQFYYNDFAKYLPS